MYKQKQMKVIIFGSYGSDGFIVKKLNNAFLIRMIKKKYIETYNPIEFLINWRNLESAPQESFDSTQRSGIVALLD